MSPSPPPCPSSCLPSTGMTRASSQDLENLAKWCMGTMSMDILFGETFDCQAALKARSWRHEGSVSHKYLKADNGDAVSVIWDKVSCPCPRAARDYCPTRSWKESLKLFKEVLLLSLSVVLGNGSLLLWLWIMCFISMTAFQIYPLSVDLGNLITMCLGVAFFMLLALGYHWASYICGFVVFFF